MFKGQLIQKLRFYYQKLQLTLTLFQTCLILVKLWKTNSDIFLEKEHQLFSRQASSVKLLCLLYFMCICMCIDQC